MSLSLGCFYPKNIPRSEGLLLSEDLQGDGGAGFGGGQCMVAAVEVVAAGHRYDVELMTWKLERASRGGRPPVPTPREIPVLNRYPLGSARGCG